MNLFKSKPELLTEPLIFIETKITKLIEMYSMYWFLGCCPDFWVKKVNFSDSFAKKYRSAMTPCHILIVIFCISCFVSLWTQHDLSQSQASDRLSFAVSNPIVTIFYHFVMLFYTKDVRKVLYILAVVLKVDYNDKKAEQDMINKSKLHNGFFFTSVFCNLVVVGLYNFVQTITTGLLDLVFWLPDATFITCLSAWPDIRDRSTPAGVTRVIVYFIWFLHLFRIMAAFLIIYTVLLCLSQQYKNLQAYFEDLNIIFDETELSQEEKELKYEVKFKKGIEQHALTLWCTDESQRLFKITFSAHVLLWCGMLVSILPEAMQNDTDSWTVLVKNAPMVAVVLLGLGYFMWPAGDITVEASNLPNAMYGSGWQNCYYRSTRIRKLVVVSMMQSQRPIELKAFGHFTFSYETYVSIVKMSYSLFSVLY